MNEEMRAAARELGVRAALTFATGAEVVLDGAQVLDFCVEEGADGALLPGNVLSAQYEIDLANDEGQWNEGGALRGNRPLLRATVQLALTAGEKTMPCGVFVVTQVDMDEQNGRVRLSGSDSIASEMAAAFEDALTYPARLSDIWAEVVGRTRYVWSGTLPNGGAVVDVKPDWKGASLRRAAGWIAQAAGCFVRVDRAGALEVVPCTGGGAASLSTGDYLTLTDGLDSFGPVTGLRVTPVGADAPVEISDGAGEMLSVEGNPLFQAGAAGLNGLMRGMLNALKGLKLYRMEFVWRGDPALGVGAEVTLTNRSGAALKGVVTRQTLRFADGLSATCHCGTPESDDAGVTRIITPEGGVNAGALVGTVDGGLLAVGSVTAKSIAAGAVTAGKIAAGSVTADKIAAGAITADALEAESVDAHVIEAMIARLNQIRSSEIMTDELYAAVAHVIDLAASTAEIDVLAAALGKFVTLYAKTGEFDFATVKNLISGAMLLEQGYGDTVTVKNLMVTSANMLNAVVGELVLKSTDGKYYAVTVGSDGVLGAEETTVTAGEIAAGETSDGRGIVETNANIANLAAGTISGERAVLDSILTGALTAGKITAGEALIASATIPALYTASIQAIGNSLDLTANESIRLVVGQAVDSVQVGGRNLIFDSDTEIRTTGWQIKNFSLSEAWESGATYTISIKGSGAADGFNIYRGYSINNGWHIGHFSTFNADGIARSTFVCPEPGSTESEAAGKILALYKYNSNDTSEVVIEWIKLEKGNKATDWSPAPEDAQGQIDGLETRMTSAEQKITPTAIVSTVTSSTSYQMLSNTASTAKSTAESAQSAASSAQSTANTAKTNAATAQSTADTAKTNAATAQSTANSAQSKANANAQDISALQTKTTTLESKVEQTANSINLSVTEKINNIHVGGRNYMLASRGPMECQGKGSSNETTMLGNAADKITALSLFGDTVTVSFDWEHTVTAGTCTMLFNYTYNGIKTFNASVPVAGHYENTFSLASLGTPPSWANENVIYVDGTYTGTVKIRNLKLEKGNKATDWSPAPEDPVQSLDTGSGIYIRKDNVHIVTPLLDIAALSDDGETEVARFDKDGVHAGVVEAEEIVSESVVRTHPGGTVTVANAGELAEVLEDLTGKFLKAKLSINCAKVTGGSFELSGVHGNGFVQFNQGTMNALTIRNCNRVQLYQTTLSTSGTALTAERSYVYLSNCTINAGTASALTTFGTTVIFNDCDGTTTWLNGGGLGTTTYFTGTKLPYGKLGLSDSAQAYNSTGIDFRTAPDPSIPTVQVVTASLSPTSTATSGYGSKLYQGRYTSSQSFRKGVMYFTLPSDLTSADKIDSATLTLKRIAGVGGATATVNVRCYNVEGTVYASKSVKDGATVNLDVTSAVKAMKSNGYTGLMLWNPSTATVGSKSYTVGYARFAGKGESGAPVLKISYRK